VLTRLAYRLRVRGKAYIPVQGAAVLVRNHVSCVDAMLLMAASPRPIRFIMDRRIFATPVPVVPLALTKVWGSFFSRIEGGQAMRRPLRRGLFNPVGLVAGPALAAQAVSPTGLRARVAGLLQASTDRSPVARLASLRRSRRAIPSGVTDIFGRMGLILVPRPSGMHARSEAAPGGAGHPRVGDAGMPGAASSVRAL